MATPVAYPSATFPESPPFVLTVPDDWLPFLTDDAIWSMRAPDADTYTANVRVSVRRVSSGAQLESVIRTVESHGFDARLRDEGGDRVVVVRRVVDQPGGEEPVHQTALWFLVPADEHDPRFLFKIVGAARTPDVPIVETVLASFRLLHAE